MWSSGWRLAVCRLVFWSSLGAAAIVWCYQNAAESVRPRYWMTLGVLAAVSCVPLILRMRKLSRPHVSLGELTLLLIGVASASTLYYFHLQATVVMEMSTKAIYVAQTAIVPFFALGGGLALGLAASSTADQAGASRWWWAIGWLAGRVALMLAFGSVLAILLADFTGGGLSGWFIFFVVILWEYCLVAVLAVWLVAWLAWRARARVAFEVSTRPKLQSHPPQTR